MKKINFFNIAWDTDGQRVHGLPNRITLEVERDFDADNEGANLLSDKYGYCVKSFDFKDVTKTQIILDIDGREYVHSLGRFCNLVFIRNLCRENYTGAKTFIKSILNVIPVDSYGEEVDNTIIDWFNPEKNFKKTR